MPRPLGKPRVIESFEAFFRQWKRQPGRQRQTLQPLHGASENPILAFLANENAWR
jgi:hypothetical protein